MPKFKLEQSPTEVYSSHGGLALIGRYLLHAELQDFLKELPPCLGASHMDVLATGIGLLSLGKSDFAAVENFREDDFFKLSLNIKWVLSESRLRQRYDEAAQILTEIIGRANIAMLKNLRVPVSPLDTGHIAMDSDASPYDNSKMAKEHVGWTYKGFDGYNPMKVYGGTEGWCFAAELRPGSWNGQHEFIYVMERAHEGVRTLTELPLLWRMDSQHDAIGNMVWVDAQDDDFIIKWNPRGVAKDDWIAYAKNLGHHCDWSTPREGKRVATFTQYVERKHRGKDYTFRRVMRVTERRIDKKGQYLLIPEVTVEGWWTSLELPNEQVIALYRDHATSEQFHSEFKTDLDVERLPSGKFDTNDLVLNMAMLTYNILKHIGLIGLLDDDSPVRHPAKRRRVRTAMQELIYIAVRLIRTGREFHLRFGRFCAGFKAFDKVYHHLEYG